MLETIKKDLLEVYKHKVDRLNHIYGVKNTALKLAKTYGVSLEKTEIVAYLHDLTKYEPIQYHIDIIKKYYDESILEDFSEPLYHAYSAAAVAKEKYLINDEDIIRAIESHTVGRPNMSKLEKIIFISDYIEPNRMYPSCVNVREIAFKDLDMAVYEAIKTSINYFKNTGGTIPKIAYNAFNYYKRQGENNV
jgi:predicted HD superfamily hydrolase involved in NAD metabolism